VLDHELEFGSQYFHWCHAVVEYDAFVLEPGLTKDNLISSRQFRVTKGQAEVLVLLVGMHQFCYRVYLARDYRKVLIKALRLKETWLQYFNDVNILDVDALYQVLKMGFQAVDCIRAPNQFFVGGIFSYLREYVWLMLDQRILKS